MSTFKSGLVTIRDTLFLLICILVVLPDILPKQDTVDIAQHFKWVYFWVLSFGMLCYATEKQWKKLLIIFIASVLNSLYIIPFYKPLKHKVNNQSHTIIRVLQFNTWASNQHPEAIIKLIDSTHPDFIGLEEVSRKNFHYLKQHLSSQQYPVFIHYPYKRLCLLSKFPITDTTLQDEPPTISGQFKLHQNNISILISHTGRPLANPGYAYEITALISRIKHLQTPIIVLGDLNTTPWSFYFQTLLSKTQLQNSQVGQGISPTYPSNIPKTHIPFAFPSLPLDHILISPNLRVIKRWNGPYSGSDHLPVIADLELN